MPNIPGLDSDVFFGDVENKLPDWREEMPEDDDDDNDSEPTEEERQGLIGMLGFDPHDISEVD